MKNFKIFFASHLVLNFLKKFLTSKRMSIWVIKIE